MEVRQYYHLCHEEDWRSEKVASVIEVVRGIKITVDSGCSSRLRDMILGGINARGWSSKVKLSYASQITVTAINGEMALCLQTGNMSRFYADLLKLQYLFQKGNIKCAMYLLPSKRTARVMGSNLVHFERLVAELKLFDQIITIPILAIGID